MEALVAVRGSVRVKDTGEPVAGVVVHIYYGTARQGTDVESDAQGQFTARVLPGRVRLQAINLFPKYTQSGSPRDGFDVPAQTEVFELPPLEVVPAKKLVGRVIDQHDRPVANASVRAVAKGTLAGIGRSTGQSDANGEFTLSGIPANVDTTTAQYEVSMGTSINQIRLQAEVVQQDPLLIRVQVPEDAQPGDKQAPDGEKSQQPATPPAGTSDAEAADARKVLEEATAAYKSLETYKSEGTVNMDCERDGKKATLETSFSIALKKPNLYLITWTQKLEAPPVQIQSGAAWSDGTQPYLYMGIMHAYGKVSSDVMALIHTGMISPVSRLTLPSLFPSRSIQLYFPIDRLEDPKIETTEKIDGDDCYVISGAPNAFTKATYWISKSSHLIRKYRCDLTRPDNGEQSTSTETQTKISSPALTKDDFRFEPPKDAVLKEPLFERMADRSKPAAPPPPATEPLPIPDRLLPDREPSR